MTTPQLDLIDDGHLAALERDRSHEVDRTPPAVCRQGLEWGFAKIGHVPRYSLDIGAGSGVFGQQLGLITPGEICRIAVEPRQEERGHLGRHYEDVHMISFVEFVQRRAMPVRAVLASNPAFSIFPDIVRAYVPVLDAVLLYGSIAWGCSEEGAALFAEHPPAHCARIIGRVNHRGPGINPASITKDCPNGKPWGADQRDVCWWLWKRGHTSRVWITENLQPLTVEQRRWTIPPGREP